MNSSINAAGPRTLQTADQIAAEKLALKVLALPQTQAIWAQLRERLCDDPAMKKPVGPAALERSLKLWTTFLALREYVGDVKRPKIVWGVDNAAHSWHGFTFPGSGVAGDNPDNIYRSTFIHGSSRYTVRGQRPRENPSTQFSIEVTRGGPHFFELKPQGGGSPDLGDQVVLVSDKKIDFAADGSFVVTLDTEPANGRRNHIQIEAGPQSVNFRDSFSDWTQQPHSVRIERVGGPAAGPELTEDDVIRNTLADMFDFILFWARFKNGWLGGPADNTLAAPVSRDGGWGFLAGTHYDLADDEAFVITTARGGAAYTGIEVCNPWMIADDGARAFTSRNLSQITPTTAGEVIYVIAHRDTGAPNWIDTSGLQQGMVILRWQQTAPDTQAASLLRDFRVVKLAALRDTLPADTPWLTPQQRSEELQQRTANYERRLDY